MINGKTYETYLDYNEILKVVFEIVDGTISYDIVCQYGNERLRNQIINNLKSISTFEQTDDPDVYKLSINDIISINIKKSTGKIESINKLTAFETRSLAQRKDKVTIFDREENDFKPKTDLHTHFAGALSTDVLIDIALKHHATYPAKFLQKVGIDISKYQQNGKGEVLLSSISEEDMKKLKEELEIPTITQELFTKMEQKYELRGAFTKDPALFEDYLRALALDYKGKGIEYAELSFSSFVGEEEYNLRFMQIMEDVLPKIEKETGVKLRFLAGIWRHSDKEWNLDDVDRIISISKSPYIVGCDFMGHETNETKTFQDELEMFVDYAMFNDPEFTIRVHAGENAIFKNNVYQAIKIIYDRHDKLQKRLDKKIPGKKLPMPKVRIGHGIYGLDGIEGDNWKQVPPEEILDMLRKMGAIVEFNMSSNLALNNINDISEIPIKRYIDAGVKVVLSTDGHGMYSTTPEQEVILAMAAGLTKEDLEQIKQTEKEVIEAEQRRRETHPSIGDVRALYNGIAYSIRPNKKRYTGRVAEIIRTQKAINYKNLLKAIAKKAKAIVDKEEILKAIDGKVPIMLTGASMSAWPKVLKEDQEYIALLTQVLADVLNSETTYIITGGTNFGVEKTMHDAIHRRNKQRGGQMVALGTFTMEAWKDMEEGIQPNTITHAIISELDGKPANNWMDLPDTQLVYTQENNGLMIGIAGGAIVSDIIQRAHNLEMNMHLMDGPKGASTDKSKSLAGNEYSFKNIEELLRRLHSKNSKLLVPDFSIENVESYIENARREIERSNKERNVEVAPEDISKVDNQQKLTTGELAQLGGILDNLREGQELSDI